MTFEEVLDQAIAMLQRRGRLTYRTLKRQFDLDDEALEDLKAELLFSHPVVDELGQGLVWAGEVDSTLEPSSTATPATKQEVPQAQPPQGASSPPEPPTPDAERRQLTVMFCDLADSTKLSGQLDPEDLRDVIRAYQSTSAEVIERYDGYIAQHLGDGLMVYFGWPQAHEDDAQRAVHVGLGILEAMRGLNARLEKEKSIRLSVRIGIHTGLVVVGEIGQGASQEHLALGETPNIASRIEGMAEQDTIAISATTYQLVQGYFDCDDLGLHTLKGVNEPKPVYRVVGESGLETRFLAATTKGLTALVGREEEIALLVKRWMQAKAGEGQVVLLSGEAGIGKSRITETLREQTAIEPHHDMHYQCSPYHTNTAFYPITEQFAFAAGLTRHDTPDEKLDKLEAHLQEIGLAIPEVAPLFADALSIPTAGRYPALDMTPQRQKERTIDALAERLLAAARQQPLLFIAEDLHWSDPSSLEAIGRVITQLGDARVLMVCTYRPEFAVPWGLDGPVTTLSLNRLSRSQTTALIAALMDEKSLPGDVVGQIVAKSDGVPLYVEELTKHMLESEWLEEKEDHYALKGPLPSLSIPLTLQDALTARLDRLPEAREVAQLGAVIGREFSYPMLQSLTSPDDATLQARLMQLVEAELIYQRGRPPQATYVFKHALIQDAAYQSLLRRTRQEYHQRIAEILGEQDTDTPETQPELLAHHYTAAGLIAQAIPFWLKAGQQALGRSANVEAVSNLSQGLQVLLQLPETMDRHERELQLQMALGRALLASKGYGEPGVGEAYARARSLCQLLGDDERLALILRGQHIHEMVQGKLLVARDLAEELARLVKAGRRTDLRVGAQHNLSEIYFLLGNPSLGRMHGEEGLRLYDPAQHRFSDWPGGDAGVQCHVWAAVAASVLGEYQRSLEYASLALQLSKTNTQPFSRVHVSALLSIPAIVRRDCIAARELNSTTMALCTRYEIPFWQAWARIIDGWLSAERGNLHEGRDKIRRGYEEYRALGSKFCVPFILTLLAEACVKTGDLDDGLVFVAQATAVIKETGERWWESETHRTAGLLRVTQASGDLEAAESCYLQGLHIARSQYARSLELRAAASLARLWQSQGKRQEAYDLLASVYGWFTEGFDTADLKDAKALLGALAE